MSSIKVNLNEINAIKKFVNIVNSVNEKLILKSGRYIIDAKSIMGIFSLDVSKPVTLEAVGSDLNPELINKLNKFIVQ